MNLLGIAGRRRDAAAAVAINGRLVAATHEDMIARGAEPRGDWPDAAIRASLAAAGLTGADIHEVVLVDDGDADERRTPPAGIAAPIRTLEPLTADALHAMTSTGVTTGAIVCSGSPLGLVAFAGPPAHIARVGSLADARALEGAAARLAATLGLPAEDALAALDRLGGDAAGDHRADVSAAIGWPEAGRSDAWTTFLDRVQGEHGGRLVQATSPHVRVQHARASLAASFVSVVAERLASAIQADAEARGWPVVALGGGWLAHRRLAYELRARLGSFAAMAAVPDATGRALGAALSSPAASGAWTGLALGPAFSDAEIKHTLDNCRLDYVYEPDWQRLFTRVSKMLEQGKVVAWFQGAAAFGGRSFGTRGVLCDPSGRYARHNMNEYLRQVPLDTLLPIVVAPTASDVCLSEAAGPFEVRDTTVQPECQTALAGALDARRHVQVHGLSRDRAPELCALLDLHYARTGTPALIEVPLGGPGETPACTPRDAVRAAYSSAIDALVVGRLLLMKDHWLLRAETE